MKLKNHLYTLFDFATACVITAIIAIVSHSQFVLYELGALNVDITLGDRLYMTTQDILGLFPIYGSVVFIGLLIAFLIAFLIRKFMNITTWHLYTLAGATAMLAIVMIMDSLLNLAFLAGARSTSGIVFQVLAGLIGGAVFAYLRKQKQATS